MGWAVGYDPYWCRDIGYGVPAWCDHPDCDEKIDRGLGYVCGGQPYGGDIGCGLYFCIDHGGGTLCERCEELWLSINGGEEPADFKPFTPTPDRPEWIRHKLTDDSWQPWRDENPQEVERLLAAP